MHSARIHRDFLINLGGSACTLIVMVVTVPWIVSTLGHARYGVMSLVWLLLGTMGFLDLGLSRAVTNALAKSPDADRAARGRIFLSALSLNALAGGVGGIAILSGSGWLLEHLAPIPGSIAGEVEAIVPWIAGFLPLALMNGVGVGALESKHRFVVANCVQFAGTVLIQIAPLVIALLVSPDLRVVVPAAVVARGLSVVLVLAAAWKSEGLDRQASADLETMGSLLRYGSWITLSNIISPLLISLDQMVIGSVLGVALVTFYAVPFSLTSKAQIFPAAASRSIFPRLSRDGPVAAAALAEQAIGVMAFAFGAIVAAGVLLMRPFLDIWMGSSFAAVAAPVGQILLVGAWSNGVAFIPFEFLQARGKPRVPALFHAVQIVPFAVALHYATKSYGIEGTAWVWSARMAVDCLALLIACKVRRSTLGKMAVTLVLLCASALLSHVLGSAFWLAIGASILAAMLTMAFGFWFDATLRAWFYRFFAIRQAG